MPPGEDRENGEESDVRDEPDDPGRRGDVEDPVVRRGVRRVGSGDSEPLGLLVARVGDREVLEADAEEWMVEEHAERGLIEQDAVAEAAGRSDIDQPAAERRSGKHDEDGQGSHTHRQPKLNQAAPREACSAQPQAHDDRRPCDDPDD